MKNKNYKEAGKALFKESKCDKSPFCPVARVCAAGAVTRTKRGFLKIDITYDAEKCVGCGKCVQACPHAAFVMK